MTKSTYEVREATDVLGAAILRTDTDGTVWIIPIDPANSDYQRYLNPEAEQSTPSVMENLTEDQ
jgi:hypothetical protein